ncbi:hypothetical protein ElyMa_002475500 [Elysia marginata]|uniref:Uncharacterized protein n=1 Tax=Elysia marginata TaxID=1093978 RepID=A0AAV4GNE2_9GAST|nr:hypothetical protein ElyMa_002475500 [Elysia marginata]
MTLAKIFSAVERRDVAGDNQGITNFFRHFLFPDTQQGTMKGFGGTCRLVELDRYAISTWRFAQVSLKNRFIQHISWKGSLRHPLCHVDAQQ